MGSAEGFIGTLAHRSRLAVEPFGDLLDRRHVAVDGKAHQRLCDPMQLGGITVRLSLSAALIAPANAQRVMVVRLGFSRSVMWSWNDLNLPVLLALEGAPGFPGRSLIKSLDAEIGPTPVRAPAVPSQHGWHVDHGAAPRSRCRPDHGERGGGTTIRPLPPAGVSRQLQISRFRSQETTQPRNVIRERLGATRSRARCSSPPPFRHKSRAQELAKRRASVHRCIKACTRPRHSAPDPPAHALGRDAWQVCQIRTTHTQEGRRFPYRPEQKHGLCKDQTADAVTQAALGPRDQQPACTGTSAHSQAGTA